MVPAKDDLRAYITCILDKFINFVKKTQKQTPFQDSTRNMYKIIFHTSEYLTKMLFFFQVSKRQHLSTHLNL